MAPFIPLSRRLAGVALLSSSVVLLSACGGSGDSSNSRSASNNPFSSPSKSVSGPLDPVQSAVIDDVIGSSIASAMPEPVGPAVLCLSDALNSLIDGPDALLLALTEVGDGADPVSSMQGASGDVTGSVERFAALLQSSMMVLAGQQQSCTVTVGGSLPMPPSSNPLAGTPLEQVGDALSQLTDGLSSLPGGGSGDDQDLKPVADTLAPLLAQLSGALDMIPSQARSAPVVGGVIDTLSVALDDVATLLPAAGAYNPAATQAATETLVNHLLSNVLLGVLPVSEIEDASGQDISGPIQAGIDQATAALGDGLGQLITPLFNDALNGALEPVLDPVEGLLAQILNPTTLGGNNPLDGLLGNVAGNGTGTPLDALLAMLTAGASGNPLSDITDNLGGGSTPLDQLSALLGGGALPLDALLGQLAQGGSGLPLLGDLTSLLDL